MSRRQPQHNPWEQRHPLVRKRAAAMHEARMAPTATGSERNIGRPEVCPGYQLANALRAWRHQHTAVHPEDMPQHIGPVQYVAEHTGINRRRVHGFFECEWQVVPSEQAELVLLAIGQEHLYGTEVQVLPSPHWSLERWVEYMAERGCI